MPITSGELVKERVAAKFRSFVKEIEAVSAEQSQRFAHADWPGHRWGIGQNGSIAGVVYHVAAWKQMTLPLLQGEKAISIREFDVTAFPSIDDWPGLITWYKRIGTEWIDRVAQLSEDDFEKPLPWEGMTVSTLNLVIEIIDHDIQHASQIEYLRQRLSIDA